MLSSWYTAAEVISGSRAVCRLSGTGSFGPRVGRAMAASGLRMPAIGIAGNNALSGAMVRVVTFGSTRVHSGMASLWSGREGGYLYVSPSGYQAVSFVAIGATLGYRQVLGTAYSGGIHVNPQPIASGFTALMQSGTTTSGTPMAV